MKTTVIFFATIIFAIVTATIIKDISRLKQKPASTFVRYDNAELVSAAYVNSAEYAVLRVTFLTKGGIFSGIVNDLNLRNSLIEKNQELELIRYERYVKATQGLLIQEEALQEMYRKRKNSSKLESLPFRTYADIIVEYNPTYNQSSISKIENVRFAF